MVREISANETFAVRQPVLRAGKPIESCRFDGDERESTKHFGYFENGNLIGIASMFAVPHKAFDSKKQFQLRGMAVLSNHQKKGIGEQLVAYAEKDAVAQEADLIWFNAREIAVSFYRKLGYEILGEPFEIGDIGLHYIMFKKL